MKSHMLSDWLYSACFLNSSNSGSFQGFPNPPIRDGVHIEMRIFNNPTIDPVITICTVFRVISTPAVSAATFCPLTPLIYAICADILALEARNPASCPGCILLYQSL